MNDLCFIILNFNSSDDTVTCVKQLQSFGEKFKIVIVDNQSSDNSVVNIKKSTILEDTHTVLIESPKNGGYSYGNNIGIRYAVKHFQPKVLGIINPDVIVPNATMLEKMIEKLSYDNRLAMIGANMIINHHYSFVDSAWNIPTKKNVVLDRLFLYTNIFGKNTNYTVTVEGDNAAEVDCIAGCFFLIKTDIFQEIGLFDEHVFLYNEENILGIKLKQMGYKALLLLDTFYYHNHDYGKDKKNSSFKKKVSVIKNHYNSRKYLIQTFYPKYLLLPLKMVKYVNIVHVWFGSLKQLIG